MDNETKVHENLIRRIAARRGLRLVKCRARDKRALGYGLFALLDSDGSTLNRDESLGRGFASLATIERLLDKPAKSSARRRR
jgi:hypothetical protein